jgi:very-short-patch-repair endonuclease
VVRDSALNRCDSRVQWRVSFAILAGVTGVGSKPDDSRLELIPPPSDRAIAELAARQHGVVATRQLAALGIAQRAVAHRAAAGRLHRVHHGVYAVGHPVVSGHGRWMAAVLACGPGAALSHAAAAALWEIRRSAAILVDVTVPRTGSRSRPGLRIHRTRDLPPAEVTTRRGIPVTTPARTLLDLAAILQPRRLERALDQAEVLRLADHAALAAIAGAHPGHHGAGRLAAALASHTAGTTLTASELEERFLALCRRHGLPRAGVNERVAGLEVDFVFRAARLAVETDGWRFHGTRRAFERDRERDAVLARAGYRTLRFTHRQLTREPGTVAATLIAALGGGATRRAA